MIHWRQCTFPTISLVASKLIIIVKWLLIMVPRHTHKLAAIGTELRVSDRVSKRGPCHPLMGVAPDGIHTLLIANQLIRRRCNQLMQTRQLGPKQTPDCANMLLGRTQPSIGHSFIRRNVPSRQTKVFPFDSPIMAVIVVVVGGGGQPQQHARHWSESTHTLARHASQPSESSERALFDSLGTRLMMIIRLVVYRVALIVGRGGFIHTLHCCERALEHSILPEQHLCIHSQSVSQSFLW